MSKPLCVTYWALHDSKVKMVGHLPLLSKRHSRSLRGSNIPTINVGSFSVTPTPSAFVHFRTEVPAVISSIEALLLPGPVMVRCYPLRRSSLRCLLDVVGIIVNGYTPGTRITNDRVIRCKPTSVAGEFSPNAHL